MEQNRQYRNKQKVSDILGAVAKIEKYLLGVTQEDFLDQKNDMMQDAVVRELEIIGEAAKGLTREFWESYPDIAWFQIAGMRNKIVHDYEQVDLVIVWDTIQEDVPKLKKVLQNTRA